MTAKIKLRLKSKTVTTSSEELLTPPKGFDGLKLVDPRESDMMALHTVEAWYLFHGRPADPEGRFGGIPGGRRFAAITRALWYLSANDNPYVDWALVEVCERLAQIRCDLQVRTDAYFEEICALEKRGLLYSPVISDNPKFVRLGFSSPYGYAVAEAITEYDFFVRLVRTMAGKFRITDEEARVRLRSAARGFRALFLEPIRWEKALAREDLRKLSRADFQIGADEDARRRVAIAIAELGPVPPAILSGAVKPSHSRRPPKIAELRIAKIRDKALAVKDTFPELDPDLV